MEIYLVGGAVRDEIMGLPVKERDWVVVGSTPAEMIEQHFQPVGKEFPVFLHPKTKEEYALARTERKTGKGYKGFVFHADPSVTLTQDLKRRDLTINAIAKDQQGRLIDPFNGQADIKNKRLRHVSEAFAEDPVRILRLARFAARFSDFTVDSTTTALMKKMVAAGEVDALVPERVWQEFSKALTYPAPWRFFNVLKSCGALEKLFPEINPDEKHCQPQNDPTLYFACLMYDLDENAVKHLCQRYRVPLDFSDLAQLVVRFKKTYACLNQEKPSAWLTFLMQSDVLRRPDRFAKMIHVFSMRQTETLKKNQQLTACVNAIKTVDISALQKKGLQGKAMADALWQLRQEAIEAVLHKSL